MRPRPSRRRADGPDHAGHGWRRGHPPHHGRDALRHRGGHGRRGATRRGCSTPWATARWTRPTRRWSAAPTCAAAAPLLRKIRNIGWLIGRYGSRPTLTPVARPSEQPDSRRLLVIGAWRAGPPPWHSCYAIFRWIFRQASCWSSMWMPRLPPAWRIGSTIRCRCPSGWCARAKTGRRTGVAGRHRRPSAYAGRWYPALHREAQGKLVPALH